MIITIRSAQQPAGLALTRKPGFPHWILSVLVEGRSRLHLADGAVVELHAGDAVVIRPRTPYRLEMPEGGQEVWAVVDAPVAWEELLAWPEASPGLAVLRSGATHADAALAAFREAEAWWTSGSPRHAALAMNALERCLLLRVLDRPGDAWADLHPGVRQAIAYLAPGPAERVTLPALARRVGLSPSYLAHTFARQVGESPLAWLEGRRIARAQQLLLTTGEPVKRLALACGFADGEHLARRFRARTGRSPGAWRERPSPS